VGVDSTRTLAVSFSGNGAAVKFGTNRMTKRLLRDMKPTLAFALVLLLSAQGVLAQQKPNLGEVDRIRIAEAFRMGQALGNQVWKGWDKAPFAVLLVTAENEFLIRHPRPSEDFTLAGYDSRLQSNIYFPSRQWYFNHRYRSGGKHVEKKFHSLGRDDAA
jgi:hypothetical protein